MAASRRLRVAGCWRRVPQKIWSTAAAAATGETARHDSCVNDGRLVPPAERRCWGGENGRVRDGGLRPGDPPARVQHVGGGCPQAPASRRSSWHTAAPLRPAPPPLTATATYWGVGGCPPPVTHIASAYVAVPSWISEYGERNQVSLRAPGRRSEVGGACMGAAILAGIPRISREALASGEGGGSSAEV